MSLAVRGLDCPQNKLMHVPSDIIHPAQVQLPESSKQVPKAAFNLSKLSVWLRRGCLDPCVSLSLTAGTGVLMCTQCSPACTLHQLLLLRGESRRAQQGLGAFLAQINWVPSPAQCWITLTAWQTQRGTEGGLKISVLCPEGIWMGLLIISSRLSIEFKPVVRWSTWNKGLWCLLSKGKPLGQPWIRCIQIYTDILSGHLPPELSVGLHSWFWISDQNPSSCSWCLVTLTDSNCELHSTHTPHTEEWILVSQTPTCGCSPTDSGLYWRDHNATNYSMFSKSIPL